jgi:hypothetical protein
MMNFLKCGALVFAGAFALATAAQADRLTKAEHGAAKDAIKANHKAAKSACDAFAKNAKSICVEQADGDEKIARADLEARNEPSAKSHYKARVARAEAEADVGKQRCQDKAGNGKDVCEKEIDAAKVYALANAKTEMKTWKANADAIDVKAEANTKAKEAVASARHDAAGEKRDADYAVAKEKCEVLAGPTKEACVNKAKAEYGQK